MAALFRGYGFFTAAYLGLSWIMTKIFFRRARLIRLPYFFRIQGELTGLDDFTCGRSLRIDIQSTGKLHIGRNVQINDHCQIACAKSVALMDNVLIASKVFITDHDHLFSPTEGPSMEVAKASAVVIEKNCWIGNGVSITKGVHIGEGSIVGSGSVVTKSFPPHSIIVGVPARNLVNKIETDNMGQAK